jgi:hypothetical protein
VTEQFAVYSGNTTVGLCVISTLADIPPDVDHARPNFSGFIFHQWRGRGLGQLSLKAALHAADERFEGKAWTTVRVANDVSQNNVQKGGFRRVGLTKILTDPHYLYLYDR